jgi:hypothetical protein
MPPMHRGGSPCRETTNFNDRGQPSDSGARIYGRTADLKNGGLRYGCFKNRNPEGRVSR